MDNKLVYREALPEDAAEYLRFLKIVGGETDNLSFGAEGVPYTPEQYAPVIERMHKREDSLMLICLDGEEIVGYASLVCDGNPRFAHRGELAIFVRKDHWGIGIGSELMKEIVDFAKNRNLAVITLEVRADNEHAKHLYRKFGFECFGRYEKFFRFPYGDVAADYMNLYL